MRHEIRLTDIGEGLEEAEIINWMVAIGDHVGRDQPVIEIMTDKSNAELPSPAAGVVIELSGAVGDMINVGDIIAVIDTSVAAQNAYPASADDPAVTPAPQPLPRIEVASAPTAVMAPDAQSVAAVAAAPAPDPAPAVTTRPKASPSTRRAAVERGIDLTRIAGSGPGGRILLADLDQQPTSDAAASSAIPSVIPVYSTAPGTPTPSKAVPGSAAPTPSAHVAVPGSVVAGTVEPLRGVRRVVANNMARSWSEIPHIHAFDHIDAEELLDLRARLKATGRQGYDALTPLSFFVAAVARALRAHPQANASIDMQAETITYHTEVNVGIAVAAPQGLVVPVLRGAGQLDFETLSLTLGQLVRGAREGVLSREHYLGGTVTITNFGALGGEQAVPLIRPPESLIIGFGSMADRPFVVDGDVVARKTMHIVAGADHRLLDGDTTTTVLRDIASSLADPLRLVV